MTRPVVAVALALATTLATLTSSTASANEEQRRLDRLEPPLDRLGVAYGQRVDDADARRLAEYLEIGVGQRVDDADVDRMVQLVHERMDIADELIVWFRRFDLPYGTRVDPGDSLLLADWLGVGVGRAVDPGDVPAVVDAARFEADHPTFALVRDERIRLRVPNDEVELIGFHQSNHDGAQQMTPRGTGWLTMEDRDRDTASRGAADIAVPKDTPILSPATGTVIRSGTYVLYCEHRDDYAVIEPDGMPGWEIKVLHIDGVQVRRGDRVEAGVTLLAPRATVLPFESQVNDHTRERDTPHVHVEVVDTSIPDRPSPGGGC